EVHRPFADEGLFRRDRGKIVRRHDGLDAGQRRRLAGPDRLDARMRMRAALDLAPQHAGHRHVGAEIGAADDLLDAVGSDRTGADDFQAVTIIRHEIRSCVNVGFPNRYSAASRGCSASSAASNRGGDIGRSRSRMPVASAIALATAAIGGTIGTSPQPRAPNGWRGFGTSTRTVSIIGMSEATGTR